MHYRFESGADKARSNVQKHGVSFEEAKPVFLDVFAIESFDVDHSHEEDRFMIIGTSERERVLVISFTLRDYETIRIISAREARPRERHNYEEKAGNR